MRVIKRYQEIVANYDFEEVVIECASCGEEFGQTLGEGIVHYRDCIYCRDPVIVPLG